MRSAKTKSQTTRDDFSQNFPDGQTFDQDWKTLEKSDASSDLRQPMVVKSALNTAGIAFAEVYEPEEPLRINMPARTFGRATSNTSSMISTR